MGFLGDLKKLFFGAKAVSKTAKSKVEDFVEDKSEDLIDHTKESLKSAKDFVEDRFAKLKEKSDLGQDASEVLGTGKDLGADLMEKAKSMTAKAGESLEDLTESAVEKSDKIWDKIISGSDKISEKVMGAGEELADKAKKIGKQIDDKMEETLEEFKRKEAQYEAKEKELDADGDGFADKPIDFGGSTLAGTEDFFEKAKRFAEGKSVNTPENKDTQKTTDDPNVLELPGFDDVDEAIENDDIVDDSHLNISDKQTTNKSTEEEE